MSTKIQIDVHVHVHQTPDQPPNEIFPIVKTYYGNSQYAQIHKMSDKSFWVQNMATLAWMKCESYTYAKGARQMIADRYSSMRMGR